MSSLFRRRKVSCFYCGQHSVPGDSAAYHPNGRVSVFTCPHCNADNHLDQKGEIVDYVPETPPKPAASFAHRRNSSRIARPSALNNLSFDSSAPPSPTFCTRCEHNQLILRSARDGYEMPPDDHPDYDYHSNVLFPQYMKDFEARYPQMCAECIPRVKQKLKQVNYQAKVASLGHMLARSERPTKSPMTFGPVQVLKWGFWVVRGVIWWWANMLFLVWHLTAAIYASSNDMGIGMEKPGWMDCVLNSYNKTDLDFTCYGVASRDATCYFPWTLLGFWWLYRQWGVERCPDKKLVGGREYLSIEIAVVLIRALSWLLLGEGGFMHTANQEVLTQAHAGFFFISVVTFLFSITCLKLEDPPMFSLRETQPPSPEKTQPPSAEPRTARHSTYSPLAYSPPKTRPTLRKQHISLTRTPPLRPIYSSQPIPPITPSYREGGSEVTSPSPTPRKRLDADEMDWDPISPTPIANKASLWDPRNSTDHSPTRTRNLSLPPLNERLALNPLVTSNVRFGHPQTPTSIFATRTSTSTDPVKRNTPMAEMKFRRIAPPSDTGLEGIFDGGLKLDDEPEIVGPMDRERESLAEVLGRLSVLVLAGGVVGFAPAGLKVLALPAVVSAALWRMARCKGSTRIWSGAEIVASLAMGSVCAMGVAEDRVGIFLVLAVVLAEVWRLLLRMQRQRKRAFWREERRNKVEREGRARSTSPRSGVDGFGFRRAGSPLGSGGFGGLSLGSGGVGMFGRGRGF